MTAAPIDNVLNAILNGDVDDHFDAILGAVNDRRKIASRRLFHTIAINTKATLKNLRPKYMVGVPVVVVGKNQTRIEVKIDPEYLAANPHAGGRFDARPFTVTPDMLDVVG